jgi:hypothetical protein
MRSKHDARELLGEVFGLVAVTVAFTALGACLGRDLGGATGLVLLIGAFAVLFALSTAPSPAGTSNSRAACCSGSASYSDSRLPRHRAAGPYAHARPGTARGVDGIRSGETREGSTTRTAPSQVCPLPL